MRRLTCEQACSRTMSIFTFNTQRATTMDRLYTYLTLWLLRMRQSGESQFLESAFQPDVIVLYKQKVALIGKRVAGPIALAYSICAGIGLEDCDRKCSENWIQWQI